MAKRTRRLALIEGVTAGIFFGTAAILIRLLQSTDVFSIAFWRLIIASAILALILLALKRSFSFRLIGKNLAGLCVLGVFLGLHFIFFVSAVKDTTILNATVLVNTAPIFSVLVSSLLFKVKPSRLAVIGLTISFAGVCIIAYADAYPLGLSLNLKGDLEAVMAAIVEAFYLNFGRKTRGQMPLLQTMLPIYLLSALVIGVLSVPAGITIVAPATAEAILLLVLLGLLPTAVAHTLYFSSLSNLKSFETATMALLEPIGATLLGVVIFREVPAFLFVFGALLILLGIVFVVWQRGINQQA